jgi:hypothetical protein
MVHHSLILLCIICYPPRDIRLGTGEELWAFGPATQTQRMYDQSHSPITSPIRVTLIDAHAHRNLEGIYVLHQTDGLVANMLQNQT